MTRGAALFNFEPTFSHEPLDSGDHDAILDMERSPGYALFVERINAELQRRQAELELTATIDSTQFCRGTIYALRTVMQIPTILKGEIK